MGELPKPVLAMKVFGAKWKILLNATKRDLSTKMAPFVRELHTNKTLTYAAEQKIESSVTLAYAAAKKDPPYFVEVACGLAIPSLALWRMGYDGEAFDQDQGYITKAKQWAEALRLPEEKITVEDFYNWKGELPERSFIIAKSPRADSISDDISLEEAILERTSAGRV